LKDDFINYLKNVEYPKSNQSWNIAGTIKGKNAFYKFDTRPLKKIKKNQIGKYGSFKTKADKLVMEAEDQWIIIDIPELHEYLKIKKLKKVTLQELISALDWNIILPKK
tara:strand:- start:21 stop:347 length:327 start_codon:yes stop_codon:yes gene_type:complete